MYLSVCSVDDTLDAEESGMKTTTIDLDGDGALPRLLQVRRNGYEVLLAIQTGPNNGVDVRSFATIATVAMKPGPVAPESGQGETT